MQFSLPVEGALMPYETRVAQAMPGVRAVGATAVDACTERNAPLSGVSLTPLHAAVVHIVDLRPQPEMVWSDAMANIARMQDEQLRVTTIGQLPRDAMGRYDVTFGGIKDRSIAAWIHSAAPQPATLRFGDFGPETICERYYADAPLAGLSTERRQAVGANLKSSTARNAHAIERHNLRHCSTVLTPG